MALPRITESFRKDAVRMVAPGPAFPDPLKQGAYEAIYKRRDIRRFLSDPIPEETLLRILNAGHQAGSVGLSEP